MPLTPDPSTVGIAVCSLIGSLGAAGAALAVSYYFLAFLREERLRSERSHAEWLSHVSAQATANRVHREALADAFRAALQADLRAARGPLTPENSEASLGPAIRSIDKAIVSLHAKMNSIEVVVRQMADSPSFPDTVDDRSDLQRMADLHRSPRLS